MADVVANASAAGISDVASRWRSVSRFAVVRHDDELAGSATLERTADDPFWVSEVARCPVVLHLGMIAVRPVFRRRGVASRLVSSACELARSERFAMWAATSPGSPASKLFAGWVPLGVRPGDVSGVPWECWLFDPLSC